MKRKRKGREVLQALVRGRNENEGKERKREEERVLQSLIQVGEIDIETEGKSEKEREAMREEEKKTQRDNQIPSQPKRSFKRR